MMRPRPSLALAGALLCCAGCAWSNDINRPVWNVFEANLVPKSDGARAATLPLTVPLGLVAILTDTLIAHPIQVIDDAWCDAGEVWDDLNWRDSYYTECGFLPVRVAATPLVFAGAWLGRALFDVPRHGEERVRTKVLGDEGEVAPTPATRAECLAYLQALATRRDPPETELPVAPTWDAELQTEFARALQGATARGRFDLYKTARRYRWQPLVDDPWLALRDADPVVRYRTLVALAKPDQVPEDLRTALRNDPSETVREVAGAALDLDPLRPDRREAREKSRAGAPVGGRGSRRADKSGVPEV